MTTFHAVKGDVKDAIIVTLAGIDTITGATPIAGYVKHTIGTPASATLTGTIENATATPGNPCSVRLQLGTTGGGWLATAATVVWRLQTQLTFPDGTVLSWPAEGHDRIIVTDDLGP